MFPYTDIHQTPVSARHCAGHMQLSRDHPGLHGDSPSKGGGTRMHTPGYIKTKDSAEGFRHGKGPIQLKEGGPLPSGGLSTMIEAHTVEE